MTRSTPPLPWSAAPPSASDTSNLIGMTSLDTLAVRLRAFAAARDWEQFHTPKNLAMALAGEVGELLAELQWLTPAEAAQVMNDPGAAARIRAELGDVTIYLTFLADALGVDLLDAAHAKLDDSDARYDPETYRGTARKAPPSPPGSGEPDHDVLADPTPTPTRAGDRRERSSGFRET